MRFIAHRGNLNGPNEKDENKPSYIDDALNQSFDAEIDLWYANNNFYLGHDSPIYRVDYSWLGYRVNNLWIHMKNIDVYNRFKQWKPDVFNRFWHEDDHYSLTSKGYVWVHPKAKLIQNSICVLPELRKELDNLSLCLGICSDYIRSYKNI